MLQFTVDYRLVRGGWEFKVARPGVDGQVMEGGALTRADMFAQIANHFERGMAGGVHLEAFR